MNNLTSLLIEYANNVIKQDVKSHVGLEPHWSEGDLINRLMYFVPCYRHNCFHVYKSHLCNTAIALEGGYRVGLMSYIVLPPSDPCVCLCMAVNSASWSVVTSGILQTDGRADRAREPQTYLLERLGTAQKLCCVFN